MNDYFKFYFSTIELIWKHYFILKLNYKFFQFSKGKICSCVGGLVLGVNVVSQVWRSGDSFWELAFPTPWVPNPELELSVIHELLHVVPPCWPCKVLLFFKWFKKRSRCVFLCECTACVCRLGFSGAGVPACCELPEVVIESEPLCSGKTASILNSS